MSMEDPFFVVKGEVQKAVNTAQSLHQRWSELLQNPGSSSTEEVDWTTNELRNSLRSIEWDLEDLDETISIVESNPKKFNLDAVELGKRKAFITSTRQTVKDMKDYMASPMAQAMTEKKNRQTLVGGSGSQGPIWQPGDDKYTPLDRELHTANSQFIEEQQTQQQVSPNHCCHAFRWSRSGKAANWYQKTGAYYSSLGLPSLAPRPFQDPI
ncbi:syntaxin-6 isoform X2 [Alosa sapidissima]|uniref:syntaxin-6 isoform X2 n=1 Tax=Alosa sapidissima TaxID=34773 RepID=UPI001C0854FA|nr:syntaxin-6 isoform X2 [Alosa sapidissima]